MKVTQEVHGTHILCSRHVASDSCVLRRSGFKHEDAADDEAMKEFVDSLSGFWAPRPDGSVTSLLFGESS